MSQSSVELEPVKELRDVLYEIEEKVVTGYTLADAIREGATVTDQARGAYVVPGESCGLGAAWLAAKARGYVT